MWSSSWKQVAKWVARSVEILRKAVLITKRHRPKPEFPSFYEQYQFPQDDIMKNQKMDASSYILTPFSNVSMNKRKTQLQKLSIELKLTN